MSNEARTMLKSLTEIVEYNAVGASDQDILNAVLWYTIPEEKRRQVVSAAIGRFGSFAETVAAPAHRLTKIDGMTVDAVHAIKIVQIAVNKFTKQRMIKRLGLSTMSEVLEYCRASMAFETREIFRILFFDKKNGLIADEVHCVGTIDQVTVYPREIIKRTIEVEATAIILVHNHPSGDPTPSEVDVKVTRAIIAMAAPFDICVHDHIIVGRDDYKSMVELRLI